MKRLARELVYSKCFLSVQVAAKLAGRLPACQPAECALGFTETTQPPALHLELTCSMLARLRLSLAFQFRPSLSPSSAPGAPTRRPARAKPT